MKDTTYYDKESRFYSQKRYPDKSVEYPHFFFKRRLDILIKSINSVFDKEHNINILEVGCADGVILRKIKSKFNRSVNLTGVDISQEMIAEAKKTSLGDYNCFLRGDEPFKKYDAVIEIGVINFTDFQTELRYVVDNLKDKGYVFCSLAGETSISNRLKGGRKDYAHLFSYGFYEKEIKNKFEIIKTIPYGYFFPYLWRFPSVARFVQPLLDRFLSSIFPNLAHEKFYILKKL